MSQYDFKFSDVSVYASALKLIRKNASSTGIHIDLGCGHGAIGTEINKFEKTYIGFDANPNAVNELISRGFEAYVVDFSNADVAFEKIDAYCAGRNIASVSMLDVIEHLPLHSDFLSILCNWIAEKNAKIPFVVSIPNLAHFDVAANLLSGRWEYTATGLLDETHQVIFTAGLLDKKMSTHGWEEIDRLDYRLEISDQYRVASSPLLNRTGGIGEHLRSIKQLTDPFPDVHQFVRAYLPRELNSVSSLSQHDTKPNLISLIIFADGDTEWLQTSFQDIGRKIDQAVDVYIVEETVLPHDLIFSLQSFSGNENVKIRGVFSKTAITKLEFWTSLTSQYWTTLSLNQKLTSNYVAKVQTISLRLANEFAISLNCDEQLSKYMHLDGWVCAGSNELALVSACPGPWILIPTSYGKLFQEIPNAISPGVSWRNYLTTMALRVGLWHEFTLGFSSSREPKSHELLGETTDFFEVINHSANELWPSAKKLSHLMCAKTESELYAAQLEISRLKQTVSWRITAPLRLIRRLISGDFASVSLVLKVAILKTFKRIPLSIQSVIRKLVKNISLLMQIAIFSPANELALAKLVKLRCEDTDRTLARLVKECSELPAIDISVVTYNSSRWVAKFVASLLALQYPKHLLHVCFVDNQSTDNTLDELKTILPTITNAGMKAKILSRPNLGFGAGHNVGIASRNSPYCLVTNIDIEFVPDSLAIIARMALLDSQEIAVWEFRQKPYEHPKLYDPVTGLTAWTSHACVLIRRSAFEAVGGYDEAIFMYGEDVELSYRLRREGFLLRYCPKAVVQHFTYESVDQIKPLQYIGSTFANLYLRLKFGTFYDVAVIPVLTIGLLVRPSIFVGARKALLKSMFRFLLVAPKTLAKRMRSDVAFSFRGFDYELVRYGAFVAVEVNGVQHDLVSVITRTYKGRDLFLKQAISSVLQQTYPNIEHIIVEDGGNSMQPIITSIKTSKKYSKQYLSLDKIGRSMAGNAALEAAKGKYCVFLDDDDLLFADHIEVLMQAMQTNLDAVAAYSPSLEVVTDYTNVSQNFYIEKRIFSPAKLIHEYSYSALQSYNYMAIQSVLFERNLYETRGGFESDMDALEDWTLWLRYAKGNKFVFVPKATSLYRTPADPEHVRVRQEALDKAYPTAQKRARSY